MSDRADFPAEPASVPAVRSFVREVLTSLGAPGQALSVAELCASELATNAVRHGHTGFSIGVRLVGSTVRIEVTDGGTGSPALRHPAPDEPGGRGLLIVSSIARRWGVEVGRTSKTVWCSVPLKGPPA
ncbi:MAG TPA: ATP-binding protein [Acidimicrobiales bacterium]|nr:ATP-binding protein [Acidimicrobiales bacterium]